MHTIRPARRAIMPSSTDRATPIVPRRFTAMSRSQVCGRESTKRPITSMPAPQTSAVTGPSPASTLATAAATAASSATSIPTPSTGTACACAISAATVTARCSSRSATATA